MSNFKGSFKLELIWHSNRRLEYMGELMEDKGLLVKFLKLIPVC